MRPSSFILSTEDLEVWGLALSICITIPFRPFFFLFSLNLFSKSNRTVWQKNAELYFVFLGKKIIEWIPLEEKKYW